MNDPQTIDREEARMLVESGAAEEDGLSMAMDPDENNYIYIGLTCETELVVEGDKRTFPEGWQFKYVASPADMERLDSSLNGEGE